MPYDTRRKSLSLSSLGIHVPTSKASKAAAANTPTTTIKVAASMSPKSARSHSTSSDDAARPSKKVKRSHDSSDKSSKAAPSKATKSAKFETTPPLSPPGLHMSIEDDEFESSALANMKSIDLSGINDEIVEAVIVRLQETRNRPHLVKELATILMNQVKIVQQSANPCAIISSRLSGYLKRSCWSASKACPLAKELETVHPRRTYFYLTVCPHQPLPDASTQLAQRAIATPSLSGGSTAASEDAESADNDRRRELSLSPEVDLSSPEFDDMEEDVPMPGTPMGSVSLSRHRPAPILSMSKQKDEPPLEKDEREFTQTADGLQKRKLSGSLLSVNPVEHIDMYDGMQNDLLFGEPKGLSLAPSLLPHMAYMTSPAMRPMLATPAKKEEADGWSKLDAMLDWDRSPESIELDELDCLLDDF
ncbi:hypothetical protein BJ166DRAFT_168775 [Pestalotiopsis sp. NC0098]|nr:hypothetical protein BJ166DRAFT_168775 [Pestalotiopsis sp. NC0098]